MINPYVLEASYTSWKSRSTGRKFYLVALTAGQNRVMGRRRQFKTATQAQTYAQRVLDRWRRLYDAWFKLPEATRAALRPDLFSIDVPAGTL